GHAPGSGQGMTQAARRRKVACPPTYFPRPVATGVDLRTVQERFACLAPGHLAAAVEKIVAAPSVVVRRPQALVNFGRTSSPSRPSSRTKGGDTREVCG